MSAIHSKADNVRGPRLRVITLNRIENRAPGRVAYVLYRGRRQSRRRATDLYRALQRWAADRQDQLELDGDRRFQGVATESDEGRASPEPADQQDPERAQEPADPTEEWTKGELYERARELDIEGRSKMNKAELLDALRSLPDDRAGDEPAESTPA